MKEFRGSVAVILSNISTNETSTTVSLVHSNYAKVPHHGLANGGMQMFKNISNTIKLVRLSSNSLTANVRMYQKILSMRGQTHSNLRKSQKHTKHNKHSGSYIKKMEVETSENTK